ncbi:MAG: hypothetical protein JWM93_1170 [Frankiales bacterium]|nr:hypothetical protein [Frankiales bacterium]
MGIAEALLGNSFIGGLIAGVAPGLVLFPVAIVFLSSTDAVDKLRGALAESATRDALAQAKKLGHIWGTVHSVQLQGHDFDHVAVAPNRIVLVETKGMHARPTIGRLQGIAHAARRDSALLAALVAQRTGGCPPVTPVVAVWGRQGRALPEGGRVFDGVLFLPGRELASRLASLRTGLVAEDNAAVLLRTLESFSKTVRSRDGSTLHRRRPARIAL